jgi:hypothetical protein
VLARCTARRPIEPTGPHPFYSEDRDNWVEAKELQPGERLRTKSGEVAAVEWVRAKPGAYRVYNLEVEEEHQYFVSRLGVLVHNAYQQLTFDFYEPPSSANNPYLKGLTPIGGTRLTGVGRAAELEVQLVRTHHRGTLDWEPREIEFIKHSGRLPEGIVGHHINSVEPYRDWAGDPRNIRFVRGQAENLLEHGGSYQNPTMGPLIDRRALIRGDGKW